jgi:hypothetical protein
MLQPGHLFQRSVTLIFSSERKNKRTFKNAFYLCLSALICFVSSPCPSCSTRSLAIKLATSCLYLANKKKKNKKKKKPKQKIGAKSYVPSVPVLDDDAVGKNDRSSGSRHSHYREERREKKKQKNKNKKKKSQKTKQIFTPHSRVQTPTPAA